MVILTCSTIEFREEMPFGVSCVGPTARSDP